jgi:type I restriction enzyme, S subunit
MAQHQVQHTGVARLQYTRFAETQQVPLPAQGVQAAIADLLGALDAKIELNERVQDASHELAAALLAEILHAAESRGVLHPGQLRDVAAVNIHKVKPAEGRLSYLEISAVRPGRAGEPAQMTWEEAPGRARRGAKDGDVLWSTVRPNRKSHCLVLSPPPDLVVSTGFAVLTPTSVGASFLYGITERPEFVDYLVSVAEGSAYPAVRGERFLEAPVVVPPRQMLDAYEAASMPLRRRAHAALRESRGLERLREVIMPPLLSGDLRVSAAEALVGEVV